MKLEIFAASRGNSSPFGFDKALDITADRIAGYTAARREAGKRPATVNRELAALRRMFSLAVRAGKLAGPPPITLLAEDNAREGFIDPPEFDRLLGKLRELGEPAALVTSPSPTVTDIALSFPPQTPEGASSVNARGSTRHRRRASAR